MKQLPRLPLNIKSEELFDILITDHSLLSIWLLTLLKFIQIRVSSFVTSGNVMFTLTILSQMKWNLLFRLFWESWLPTMALAQLLTFVSLLVNLRSSKTRKDYSSTLRSSDLKWDWMH